ncbi:MAG: SDR family NAD(P)-dependent oxidoreductase [Pedobacter sp.]|nr:MAG: SDR family NAD(P)-dependent oxidoreductase [Pedobacter sp.]
MRITNKKILVTGGASGIGMGLTERFLKDNNTVIICGRRAQALEEVSTQYPNVITFQCDLEQESGRVKLYNWLNENHADLNILVNNAGIQNWMKVEDERFYEKAQQEININITAPVHLTQLLLQLPSLDTIMNVSSGLAFVPLAQVPVYCATKAFLRSFTLSLRHQLKGKKTVIEIIPPALNTDLGAKGLHSAYPPVSEFITSIFDQLNDGKEELTFGTSAARANTNNESIESYFNMMNP